MTGHRRGRDARGPWNRRTPEPDDDREEARGVVTAVIVAEDDGTPEDPLPGGGSFLDSLVARLSGQYGVDPRAVRSRAEEVLVSFADARVQAFVPILVEKRLRDAFGRRSGLATILAAIEEFEAAMGMAAGAVRRT